MTPKMYLMICYYCWKNIFCWNKFKTWSWVLFIFQIFSSMVFTQNNVFCKVFFEQQKYLIDTLYYNYIMNIMEQLPKVKIQDNCNILEISQKKKKRCAYLASAAPGHLNFRATKQNPRRCKLKCISRNAWCKILKCSFKGVIINIFPKTLRYALVICVYFKMKMFILENICVWWSNLKPPIA